MPKLALVIALGAFCVVANIDDPAIAADQPPASAAGIGDSFQSSIAPFLKQHCTSCHGATKPKGSLNLAAFTDEASARAQRKTWSRVLEYMEGGMMPPEDKPQPSADEVGKLIRWIKSGETVVDCGRTFDPGRVTIRRLNRVEYNNTIRDLVGVDFHPADDFPSDDVGYGFDNIGDVLSLPPILMEKYLAAAETIAEAALGTNPHSRGLVKSWDARTLGSDAGGVPYGDSALLLATSGEVSVQYTFPRTGDYVIHAFACGQQAGPEPVKMAVRIDGKDLKRFDVTARDGDAQEYQFRQKLKGGSRRLSVAFLNDYYDDKAKDPKQRDRNMIVEKIEVEGPLQGAGEAAPSSRKRIIFREPKSPGEYASTAHDILERFATRAYRRPVTEGELAKLVKLVELVTQNGDKFERGIQLAVQAVLVSPQFLFRVELGRRPVRASTAASSASVSSQSINDFELASRISYFLWSTMPDDELSRLASLGQLRTGDMLDRQVRRMLKDPKAQAFVESFAGQWLQIRNLRTANPDKGKFPEFDEALRAAMIRETELFFGAVMRDDLSVLEFLDSDFTYVNERLAKHYGFAGVQGDQFRRVKLKSHDRGGLITQASILTVTSNPTRTSPVKRGKWVLEQILGTPPPPPPPDVPVLDQPNKPLTAASLRQKMEEHRAKASCAACHAKLDPLGFGLENFNGVGLWRDKDGSSPIDSSGTLPSGESFRGPKQLKGILMSRKDQFLNCLTRKMLTYALGRGLEDYDRCAVDKILADLAEKKYHYSALVIGIIKSEPFQKRRD
jgi:mono/diheme cytochrome c family protein